METVSGTKSTVGEPAGAAAGRVVVVAAAAIEGEETIESLRRELAGGGPADVLVIAPALTESALEHVMGSVDDAMAEARERLDTSLRTLAEAGIEARGHVGDSDPLLAIEDALREARARSIAVVTASEGHSTHWLEGDLFDRARRRFQAPIVHVGVESDGSGQHVAELETSGEGADSPSEPEVEGFSRNMPRFSVPDLAGIVIAVVGSLAAIIIAAGCDDGETIQRTAAEAGTGSSGSCVAAYIVAGVTTLINGAHVVGLVLFESAGYRGGFARFFAGLSLIGTPLAVIATLLLAH